MSTLTIIGIILTALGTIAISVEFKKTQSVKIYMKITGTLLIAIGSFFMVNESSRSIEKINQNIESFRIELEIAQRSDSSDIERVKVVSDKFENWAKNFSKNKEQKEINTNRKVLSLQEKEIKANNKYYSYYQHLTSTLERALVLYNSNEQPKIKYDFSILPTNIMSSDMYEYESFIRSTKYLWKISFCCKNKTSEIDLPSLYIESKLITSISGYDTISNLRKLSKVSFNNDNEYIDFEPEFLISASEDAGYFNWMIIQKYGNIDYKVLEQTTFLNNDYYERMDQILVQIIETILLN